MIIEEAGLLRVLLKWAPAVWRNSVTPQTAKVHTCYCRCDKTAFIGVLATLGTTLLAQVVLTLRSVSLAGKVSC